MVVWEACAFFSGANCDMFCFASASSYTFAADITFENCGGKIGVHPASHRSAMAIKDRIIKVWHPTRHFQPHET